MALGLIGQLLLGMSFLTSMLIMGGVVIVYTLMGGLWAVAITDVVQMILNAFGIMVILPFLGLTKVDGLNGLLKALPPARFDLFSMGGAAINSLLVWIIPGAVIAPELWVRLFAADTPKNGRLAVLLAALLVYLPHAICVGIIGLTGAVLFHGVRADTIMPQMILKLAPGLWGGVMIASLLAAVMSCADSVILVTATNVSRDIYQRLMNPNAPDHHIL
jgi:SSS family solute:Na+ symporter